MREQNQAPIYYLFPLSLIHTPACPGQLPNCSPATPPPRRTCTPPSQTPDETKGDNEPPNTSTESKNVTRSRVVCVRKLTPLYRVLKRRGTKAAAKAKTMPHEKHLWCTFTFTFRLGFSVAYTLRCTTRSSKFEASCGTCVRRAHHKTIPETLHVVINSLARNRLPGNSVATDNPSIRHYTAFC